MNDTVSRRDSTQSIIARMMGLVARGEDSKRHSSPGWRYAIPVVIVALLGTLVTLGLAQRQRNAISADLRVAVDSAVDSTMQTAAHELGVFHGSMDSYRGLFDTSERVTPAEFSTFTTSTFANRDGINFVLYGQDKGSTMPVRYGVGEATAAAAGFDILSEPISAKAAGLARRTDRTVLVGQRSSGLGGPPAVFAFTPVTSERGAAGMVVAAMDAQQWMSMASAEVDLGAFSLALADKTVPGSEVLWATSDTPVDEHPVTVEIAVSPLQTLSLTGTAGADLLSSTPAWRPWAVLVTGLLATAGVCALVWWWLDARRIKRTAADLQKATNRLRFLAEKDALTGLSHRDGLRGWLDEWETRNPGRDLGVIYVDLDNFKEVNTTWGHFSGDLVLRQIAHRLSALGDDPDCVVARISGDQFIIMRAVDLGPLDAVASAVHDLVTEPIPVGDRDIQMTSSIGIAVRPEDGNSLDTLINNADIAVRHAKAQAGNTVIRFNPAMAARDAHRQQLGREFRAAMRDPGSHFVIDYQPQVDMRTGQLVAAEALIRWNRGGRWESPADFLPTASDYGLMPDLGRWVLRESCLTVQRWRQDVPAVVAVNVDAQQLDADFADIIGSVLQETCTPSGWVMVEITEGAAMGPRAQRELDRVRAQGVSISIDDFGTGFSSLSRLTDLPTQQVKIDRAFVQGLGQSNETLEIVRAIVALATALGLEVLAEGVETVSQARVLLDEGVYIAQGFLFAPPVNADECLELWRRGVSVPALHH
jgi:diguanylate cyclase (GGDEF)-like protein